MKSSSIAPSLPTAADIAASIQNGNHRDNSDRCQQLVLQCLRHGTLVSSSSETSTSSGGDPLTMESLSARRDEACRILSEAWNMTLNDSAHCSDFQHVLLDSLWLLSSSLTEVTATSTQQDMATANEQDSPPNMKSKVAPHFQQQQQHPLGNPSMDALLFIITSLLQASETIAKSQPKPRESFAVGLQSNLYPSLLEKLLGFNSSSSSVKTNDDLMKRLRMYNTQVNYKQHKYNLLQEESEGYAKVLQFLHLQPTETNNGEDEDRSIGHLQHLVGSFELDPNRVLELAVDALEQELHATSITDGATWNAKENHPCVRRLVSIIQTFPMNKLASIISFRLQKSAPDEGVTAEDTMEFYATVAFLVHEGAVDLPTLMRYLNPVEDEIENAYKAYWIKEKGKILALTRISLTGGTNSKDDPKQAENLEKYERLVKPLEENPTLIIVLSLIESGNWRLVKPMLSDESWSYLCCLMPQTFGCAMCDVAENVVDEWFGSHRNSKLQSTTSGARGTVYNGKRHSESDGIEKVEEGVIGFVESLWDPLSSVVRSGCISDRPTLFCDICRILKRLLENVKDVLDFGYGASSCVYDFLSKFLVPSNSLFPSNPAVSTELWLVLQQLPYPIRYTMYSEWKGMGLGRGGMSSMAGGKPLPNVLSEVETGKAARYVLKRLSKENIRDMSRQLAKVTHANPLVVYATILDQIESYDNMVEVMVEAQRFVSPLGLDVLGYCILGRLSGSTGGVNRSRLKEDGVNVSQWLQSLETFIGEFYKWRPFVEMQGILSYLMRQLKNGHVMELGVLRTLLKVAGGFDFADYSPTESLSENQLSGRAGSLTLQRETMSFGIKEETNPRATKTIRTLLQTDGRGVALLVLIAQARDRILFDAKRGSSKNIKLAGNLYDSCQVVMAILLNFLVSDDVDTEIVLETKQRAASLYSESLPSLQALHASFGLDFETAWFLCRPAARIGSSGDNIEKSTNSTKYDLTSDVCEAFSDCLSDVLFEYLTPKLLEFFQMNASYDIFFPEKVYSAEIERVDKDLDRIRVMNSAPSKQDSETLEPQQALSERLQKDKMSQSEHVQSVLKELDEEKSCFFVSEDVSHESARLFLSHCVFPRSLQSPDDAMYSAAFAFRLHKIWTPGFSVIHFLDEMIALVAGTLFGLTEGEAANLAVLIWQTWKIASKWRYDEGVFDREVLGKPGSQMVEILNDGEKTSKSVSHLDFIKLYRKWHSALGTTLIGCLLSPEYMHIRAGLLVLTRLVDIFPTRPPMGEKILEALSPLQDENTSRPDIRASANAYGMMLLKARDDGKWFEENEADAKARAEKEAEAAIERKKQLQQNFQELERDSSNIAAEVGPRDRSDRRDVTTPKASEVEEGRQLARGTGQSNTRSGELSRMESGEQREYRSAREDDRRDREHRSDDRGRGLVDSNGEWRRDPGNLRDDRRWPRDETSSRNAKRSRPSSPESDREAERGNSKRQRIDVDEYPPRRNNSGRNDPSPPSRRSRRESPEPPSRSRPRRSRR